MGFWQRIVPAHIWSEIDDIKTFTNDEPVGFGPYKFTEIVRGQHYILERVDEFFLSPEGKPYLEKVIWKPYPDVNTMVLALKSGDIDLTAKEIPATTAAEFEGDDKFTVVQNQDLGYEHIAINLTDPILKDVNVRTAIAMAVNRDEIINFAFDGSAEPMPGIISPVYQKYQIGNDLPSYDVEGAKNVLADAGYKDTNNDGVLNAPNGEELSFTLMFANSVTTHEKVSRIVVDNLKAIGIEAIPQPMDKSLQTDKLYGEWQLTINTWGAIDDVESSMATLFESSAALNWMQYNNPKADEAMNNMKAAVSEEDIMKYMDEFQKEMVKDIPDIPLVVKKNNYAYNSKFEGFVMVPSTLEGLVHPGSLSQVYINE
jgi:peptide/nickel transport system substrate-binding protein